MEGVRGRQRWLYPGVLLVGALMLIGALVYEQRASASPTGTATIALVAPAQARAGSLITVDLVASNVRNLAGYQATIKYDSAQMRLVGASIADDLKRGGRDVLPLGPTEQTGAVVLGAVSCPVRKCSDARPAQAQRIPSGIDGTVKVGTVRFYAAAPGSYPLTLADVRLVDPQGQFLPVTATSIVLNVSAP
ncbi:MAG TPA: cohesin domain-containing protein [Herpetosiphonaceae bacterium]